VSEIAAAALLEHVEATRYAHNKVQNRKKDHQNNDHYSFLKEARFFNDDVVVQLAEDL
jgi:hypothetical protein